MFLFGLAPGGVYLANFVAEIAVRSYRTFSPLPYRIWRYIFCGTFPAVAHAGRYPAPSVSGARTFLYLQRQRPSNHLIPPMIYGVMARKSRFLVILPILLIWALRVFDLLIGGVDAG